MDPQNNQLPQQPIDNTPGVVPPTPPQPGQQFVPGPQPGMVMPGGQPQPQPFQQSAPAPQPFQPQVTPQPQQPFAPGAQPGQPFAPFTPQPDGGYPTGMPVDQSNKKKLRLIVLLVTVLVVAALAAVSYFAFFKKDESANKAAKKSSTSSKNQEATDMATLQGVTMSLSRTPDGYTAQSDPTPTMKLFTYSGQDGKEECEFSFGTVGADVLPGADLDAIIRPQIDQLRDLGATVDGPSAGTALIVKDASTSETYRMPTLDFKFSKDGDEAVVHYSAVILKSGERAVINRGCGQKGGSVNMDRLKSLDETAKNIVVTKK